MVVKQLVWKPKVTAAFLKTTAKWTWPEVLFGLEYKLLENEAPVELALDETGEVLDPPEALMQLGASSKRGRPVKPLVEKLAQDSTHQSQRDLRAKWLYLALAWVRAQRAAFEDPWATIEMIYEAFEEPAEMEPFVPSVAVVDDEEGRDATLWARLSAFVDEQALTHTR